MPMTRRWMEMTTMRSSDDLEREELSQRAAETEDHGSGRGGPLGTPTHDPAEAPPAYEQEKNEVISGGGLIDPDDPATEDNASSR